MALNINNDIYTGGYQVVDTRPHVQMYAQLKAREQARNDAFDEYMRNINLKINPAGMRYQDMPAFEHGLKKMQEFGIQNRDAIQNPRKDGGLSAMKFQQMYQQQMNRIAGSKMAAEGLKPFIDVQADPKKSRLLNKDRAMTAVQFHDQPQEIQDETGEFVPNPNFKPFNPSELEFREEDFDLPKYFKELDYIKPSEKTQEIISTDPKTLMRKVRTTSKFKPEDYDKLASIGVQTYYSDPSMKQLVDQMFNDPNNKEVVKLNELFKNKFGQDIQNEGDLAAAMTIAGKETTEEEMKVEDDKFEQAKKLEAIKNANRKGLLYLKDSLDDADEEENDLWYDSYIDEITKEAQSKNSSLHVGGGLGWEIPIDAFLAKNLAIDGKSPDKLVVTNQGEYVPIFYKRDADGKIERDANSDLPKENQTYTKPINRTQLKVTLGGKSGVKQLNKEMSSGNKKNESSTYSNVQPATYNGKKITVGVRDGRWYNTATGEEIK